MTSRGSNSTRSRSRRSPRPISSSCCAIGSTRRRAPSRWPSRSAAISTRSPPAIPAAFRASERGPDEDDERYRRRIWLSPATLSPHGTEEAYVFWALSADRTLHDASATTVEGTGRVKIAIMRSAADPLPTQTQLLAVRAFVHAHSRKALTDIVSVVGPAVRRDPLRAGRVAVSRRRRPGRVRDLAARASKNW